MKKKITRREEPETHGLHGASLHPLMRRIYATRKIASPKELEKSLQHLLPYDSLLGIHEAAELLGEALSRQEKILVVGDFDADGATSSALAVRALRYFGAQHVTFLVPNRFAFGYGLTPELVKMAEALKPQLIVTVDNGIANHAGVETAKALGIKVLITDHHLAAPTLPPADAIVNPNQPGCPFPSKNLAGVGVIFYVMLALRRYLIEHGWFEKQHLAVPVMAQLLDLVALGTVADLVPLDHNNRILVHHGLQRIRSAQCSPGILALLELAKRDFSRVVAADLGFAVASRLNAAGRMDDMSLGITALICDDPTEVRQIARQLDSLNEERRHIELNMHAQALEAVETVQTNLQGNLPSGITLFDETWHQGVIGILASRIKDKYHRPVIVFAPGNEDEIKGSARSIPGFHIRDALALIATQYPHLLKKFGGHAMAAGLTLIRADLPEFTTIFNQLVATKLNNEDFQHALITDGDLSPNDFNLEVANLLRDGGPWGQLFPEPLFDGSFQILEQYLVGEKHLKLRLKKENQILEAVAFFVDLKLWPNRRCDTVHAVYRLDVNEYRGKSSVQLILEYLEPVTVL